MDRIALSKRLGNLSTVFAGGHPMQRDLHAMSLVLTQMSDEKFASVLSKEFEADPVEATEDKDAAQMITPLPTTYQPGKGYQAPTGPSKTPTAPQVRKTEHALAEAISDMAGEGKNKGLLQRIRDMIKADPDVPQATKTKALGELKGKTETTKTDAPAEVPTAAQASEDNDGSYWNREASAAIMNNLVRDVTGMDKTIALDTNRHLTLNEMPDGKHAGVPVRPPTLKPDQTPNQVDVLDSNIVAKSNQTPLKKEAADEAAPAADVAPAADAAPAADVAPAADAAPAEEAKAEEKKDEPKAEEKKDEETPKEAGDKASSDEGTTFEAEGIELVAPMEEVTLDDGEAAKLSKLFS